MAKVFAKDEATVVAPDKMVKIDLAHAEALENLAISFEAAEAHYHSCQATNFRQYVEGVFNAGDTVEAFEALKEAIRAAKQA